jgi:mono/diheme cytochrome c family protein
LTPAFAGAETSLNKFLEIFGGEIPFPPEKIVKTLEAQGYPIFGEVVIPNGRSLQRRSTDYKEPRSLVSFSLDAGQRPYSFIYIAYTPRLNQLEIIAGKPELPYDFLVVKNYSDGQQHAMPAAPAQGVGLCLACHQNGGPIFPRRGSNGQENTWFETDGALDIRAQLENATDPFALWLRAHYPAPFETGFDNSVRFGVLDPGNLPSSVLFNRFSFGHESEITPGSFNDPLIPRLTDGGKDPFSNPSTKWTISLVRDGTQSYPAASPKQLFAIYCSACHAGANSVAPTLPLSNLQSLATYQGVANRKLRDLLAQKIMPPIGSALPSPEDRSRMSDALK